MAEVPRYQPGDRLKLTGDFLRNTGQLAGGEGQTVFTVVPCGCVLCQGQGTYVAVDQPSQFADDDSPRHVLAANLYKVGTRHARNFRS